MWELESPHDDADVDKEVHVCGPGKISMSSRNFDIQAAPHSVAYGYNATNSIGLALQDGTRSAEASMGMPRKVSLLDWGNMDHPDNFGTHYNGTLTLVVNGLSLEKNWFDSRKVPHWAFTNATDMLASPFENKDIEKGKVARPSGMLRIMELENGERLPYTYQMVEDSPHSHVEPDILTTDEKAICVNEATSKRKNRDELHQPEQR